MVVLVVLRLGVGKWGYYRGVGLRRTGFIRNWG